MANGDVAPRIISPGTRWKTVCLTLWPLWVLPAPHDSRLDRLQKRPESFKKKKKKIITPLLEKPTTISWSSKPID
jgi:hypothetical protein